jgi:hypothetical protein
VDRDADKERAKLQGRMQRRMTESKGGADGEYGI